jgi:hypothetical protein
MFPHYRRFWVLVAAALLAAPLAFSPAGFLRSGTSGAEQRALAPPPALPATLSAWFAFPRQAEAFLNDHFGLRDTLIGADAFVRHALLRSGNANVLIGRDGWLFFRGDDMIEQSAGIVLRNDWLVPTADLITDMRTRLAAIGIPLVMSSPPNSSTIYPEMLPDWARSRGGPTEYDVLMSLLASRGVKMLDLRPVLLSVKAQTPAYDRLDTHWTPRGALAAFNAMTGPANLPDWKLSPAEALGPPQRHAADGLRRMLDMPETPLDMQEPLLPPRIASYEELGPGPFPTFVATAPHQGPTIMVIGDSFTNATFLSLVLHRAGRLVWTHYRRCSFDWTLVDRFKPDQLWLMPTERYLTCIPGFRPAGLPASATN